MNRKDRQEPFTPKIRAILERLKQELTEQLGDHLRDVILYGSYAMGEAEPDSDLDLLVVTQGVDDRLERRIDKIAYDLMWEYDFQPLLSVMVVSEAKRRELQDRGSSFHRSIQREGISV